MDKAEIIALFEKYIRKLRITPAWDVRLEFVDDPTWQKTGQRLPDLIEAIFPSIIVRHKKDGKQCP